MGLLDLIGNTPLVELKNMDTGPCRIFLKLESQNPGGSIKDRVALSMIDGAERLGKLKPGGTIVEATAGNTGLGLALIGSQRGYKVILVIPDKMSREKVSHLRALGAEVVLTRSDVTKGHPEYYQDMAPVLAKEIPGAWHANQFSNPDNPLAHILTTGPEVWQQMEGQIDAVVVGVGSGGTLGGLTKFFSKQKVSPEFIIADPEGSIVATYAETGEVLKESGSWLIEGIGEDFIPVNADFSMVKGAYRISDRDSFITARELLRTNGIFAGSSTGTLLAAAIRYAREQTESKRILTFVCDGGDKYLSKMYSDYWMADQGFLEERVYGDLRDLISHHYSSREVVTVGPKDTIRTAHKRMKMYDISQLPVIDQENIIGIVDESDVLIAVHSNASALDSSVDHIMTTSLKVISPNESPDNVFNMLTSGLVALVADADHFYGIITKMDLVDYLRKTEDRR